MRLSIRLAVVLVATALAANVASSSVSAQTLKTVQERGALNCGVSQGLIGFSIADDKGAWSGFDVDFCRAVAAAVFGDPSKVHFVPLTADERFTALHDKQIDLLSRNSTWTMGRETELGLVFAGVTYYDGQAFLVPKSRNLQSALELDGSKVCVQSGTTTEPNFVDYFETNHMKYEIVRRETAAETLAAYRDGQCNVLTSDEFGPLCAAPATAAAGRPCDSARRHLQGAARPGGTPGRHAMVQYRPLGQFRDDRRGGIGRGNQYARRGQAIEQA